VRFQFLGKSPARSIVISLDAALRRRLYNLDARVADQTDGGSNPGEMPAFRWHVYLIKKFPPSDRCRGKCIYTPCR